MICHSFLLTVESTRHIDTPWLPLTNSAAAVAVVIEDTLVGVTLSDRRQLFVPLLRRGNGVGGVKIMECLLTTSTSLYAAMTF